ncbi:MAG TPA: VIT1/CCC1 transporter family protein [Blastocatellia bacterium]|nr:VIT1/CCC1 transporter family protein [Blastocatellia bacterium]
MPRTPHVEKHFTAGDTVRDIVIGMSDGLTVPFALAAGLSGALAGSIHASRIIVTGGFAEIAAGAIAMGLGGYLAARSDAEHYASEMKREQVEVLEIPMEEQEEVAKVFRAYGLTDQEILPILRVFSAHPQSWVDFMMRYELGLERPDPGRALKSASTIGGAYIAGGLIPLTPYILLASANEALIVSIGATLLALFVFGFVKGRFTGAKPLKSALQTALIGSLAAGAAFLIARLIA